jgi:membrane-associated phospholipid phosphatase
MLSIAILALNPKFDITMENSRDRIFVLLSSSFSYYIGFVLLGKLKAFPVFKLFLVASVLVIIVLLIISFRWKISNHMAAIGGLTGTVFALSFRGGVNPLYTILLLVLVSGIIGTARLILEKHTISQVLAGYLLGFFVLYLVVYFI